MHTRTILKKLGREVQERREERKLSQEELAHESQVHLNSLKKLEWGNTNSQVLTLFGVAKGLNMPLSELIARVERRT